MQTPFGDRTLLELPPHSKAGAPFVTTLTIVNESSDTLISPIATITFPRGVTPLPGTLQVDGRPQARTNQIGDAVRATLAPLRAGVTTIVTVSATIDVPVDNGSDFTVSANIAGFGHSRELAKVIVAESAFSFSEERTYVEVKGDNEIGVDEERDGLAIITNDGTATARDALLDLGLRGFEVTASSHAVGTDGSKIAVGDVDPGNNIVVEFTLRARGEEDPIIAPHLHVGNEVNQALPERHFRFVQGAEFTPIGSRLVQRGDAYIVPGASVTLDLQLTNEGARTAKRPVVELALPYGVSTISGDASVQFENIDAGATSSRSVVLRVDAENDSEINATVDRRFKLSPLTIRVGAMTQFVPVRVALKDPGARLIVEQAFPIVFEVLNEGNVTADFLDMGLDLGPGLRYVQDSLTVNRIALSDEALMQRGFLRFADIQPGAVIEMEVHLAANRPTLRGSQTTFTGVVRWNGDQTRLSSDPFTINPAPIYAKDVSALPFTIVDSPMLSGGHGTQRALPASGSFGETTIVDTPPAASTNGASSGYGAGHVDSASPAAPEVAPVEPEAAGAVPEAPQHGDGSDDAEPAVLPSPMGDAERNALISTLQQRFLDDVPPLAAYISLARMLLPRQVTVGSEQDVDYKNALNAFKTVATIAGARMGSASDREFPVDELASFHESAIPLTLRQRDDLRSAFPSVDSNPSVAAGIAALLHYAGFGLSEEASELPAVDAYVQALKLNLSFFDHLSLPEVAGEMFNALHPVAPGVLATRDDQEPIETIGLREAVEGVREAFAPVAA